ncbi:conserved phage C-terminal domain-containing protein [Lysinibacillus sphaericus]|uniref:conserved phage C-terminal domain-containing protein n=1 Tax=Lysinibacillus sphaericus TaxID=1421 RepID=UPI0021611712|nr:conserved phage C-terminal domain-containing protein [Lysinibacillus sphaericus]MCS1384802.1 conserved phage C-terminal domain-containing protein [Lysinibacillus sphaericus]
MNLLINEPPLQVLPSLAAKVGLNEAIVLQQLHYKLLISAHVYDGHKWVFNSYQQWKKDFPFWSEKTIRRTIRKLEENGYIISTDQYNKYKIDKTKWYRLNYTKLGYITMGQHDLSSESKCPDTSGQYDPTQGDKLTSSSEDTLTAPITKDIKSNKNNNNVEQLDIVHEIIAHLNKTAQKNFKATTAATNRLIHARLKDGYTLDHFKCVIDTKAKQWLHNPDMNKYLRPDTLFNATKFESYLNEKQSAPTNQTHLPESLDLDFSKGENL